MFPLPSEQYWKIYGNLRKVVGNLQKIIENVACIADETKPRYSPSANQQPLACSTPRVLPRLFIIGSNWLLHMAVLLCTVIGRVDLVEPWLRFR